MLAFYITLLKSTIVPKQHDTNPDMNAGILYYTFKAYHCAALNATSESYFLLETGFCTGMMKPINYKAWPAFVRRRSLFRRFVFPE